MLLQYGLKIIIIKQIWWQGELIWCKQSIFVVNAIFLVLLSFDHSCEWTCCPLLSTEWVGWRTEMGDICELLLRLCSVSGHYEDALSLHSVSNQYTLQLEESFIMSLFSKWSLRKVLCDFVQLFNEDFIMCLFSKWSIHTQFRWSHSTLRLEEYLVMTSFSK